MDNEDTAISEDLRAEAGKLGIKTSTEPKEDESPADEEKPEPDTEEAESEDDTEESVEEDDEEESDKDESEKDESKDDEEESEEEDDSEEEEQPARPRNQYIPKRVLNERKAKWEGEKTTLLDTVSRLQSENERLTKNQKPAEISPKIKALAEKLGIEDPKNMQEVLNVFREEVSASNALTPEMQKDYESIKGELDSIKQTRLVESDRKYFSTQWDGFKAEFTKEFPGATAEETEKARALMDSVWHTPKFADKDIDYVFFKNKSKFDAIISPRKRGLETGRVQGNRQQTQGKIALGDNPSAKKIADAEKRLNDIVGEDELERSDSDL